MGTCASQQSSVVCRPDTLAPPPPPPTQPQATPGSSFHPALEPSESELRCRKTAEKLVSVKESVRTEVSDVLTTWENSGQLSEIESHALSISPTQAASISELSEALTHPNAKYVTSLQNNTVHVNIAKAYIIYYWVATNIDYDKTRAEQSQIDGKMDIDVQPAKVLAQRKGTPSGFSGLYQALACKADLEVETVKGNVKTWRSMSLTIETASGFTPNDANSHNWNMVKLSNGVWFPVDCTYGSGCIEPSTKVFTRYYFAALPRHMILTHWPLSKKWQLLENPISLRDYQDLVPLAAPVAAQGALPQMWCERIHIPKGAQDPVATVRVHKKPGTSFSTSLVKVEQNAAPSVSSNTAENSAQVLENNVFVQESDDDICFRVAVPQNGCFALNIYIGKVTDASALNSQLAFSYLIECEMDPKYTTGYPMIFTKASKAFEFELLHWNLKKSYSPENETGTLDIVFRAQPKLQFNHYLLPGIVKATDDSRSCEVHSTMMVSKLENDESRYKLRVIFPSEGWWSIFLWAAKPNNASGDTALLNYQVYAKSGQEGASYPHIYTPDITMDIQDPIKPTGTEVHSIAFRSLKCLDFRCFLTNDISAGERLEELVTVEKLGTNTSEQVYKVHIVYPKPGKWFVHVFSREKYSTEETYHKLFDFPVEVEHSMEHTHFAFVDEDFAEAQGIVLKDNSLVTFHDSGEPLLYHFEAPTGMEFMHTLKRCNSEDTLDSHYTYLSAANTGDQTADYTLRAVFPSPGRWTLEVFSKCIATGTFKFVFNITVDVNRPITSACFPKLYHSFYQLGLSIPQENALYNTSCEAGEFQLPFEAPDDITFRWSMQHVKRNTQLLNHSFVHYCPNSSPNRIFHLLFSELGEWIASLYGKRKADKTTELPVLDLRIKATNSTIDKAFPQIYEPFRATFQLNFDKSHLPIVSRAREIPSTITINFLAHSGVKFWHDATLMDTDMKQVTRMISNNDTGVNELTAELTENGQWVISLCAQHADSVDKEWIPIMNHTIQVL